MNICIQIYKNIIRDLISKADFDWPVLPGFIFVNL